MKRLMLAVVLVVGSQGALSMQCVVQKFCGEQLSSE